MYSSSRLIGLSTIIWSLAVGTASAQFYHLNVIAYNVATNAPVVGARVEIYPDHGNGTTRYTDGGGFANFGVEHGVTTTYDVSASGFQSATGTASALDHQTIYVGLQASGGGGGTYYPSVYSRTENNIETKFWDTSGDTGDRARYLQGWIEIIDHNVGIHGYRFMHFDKLTNTLTTHSQYVNTTNANVPGVYAAFNVTYGPPGPGQRAWAGVYCGDTPAIKAKFNERFNDVMMAAIGAAAGTFYGTSATGPAAVGAASAAGMAVAAVGTWWQLLDWGYACIF